MSNVEDACTFTVTWIAQPNACRKCAGLDGHHWLVFSIEEVTEIKEMSSHPHCHCEVDVDIDVDLERLQIG